MAGAPAVEAKKWPETALSAVIVEMTVVPCPITTAFDVKVPEFDTVPVPPGLNFIPEAYEK